MTNTFFSGRIPQQLNDHATEFARSIGKTKTEILIEALAQYTGFNLATDTEDCLRLPVHQLIEQLQQQVKDLQETLNIHTMTFKSHGEEINTLKNQLAVIETLPITSSKNNNNHSAKFIRYDKTAFVENSKELSELEKDNEGFSLNLEENSNVNSSSLVDNANNTDINNDTLVINSNQNVLDFESETELFTTSNENNTIEASLDDKKLSRVTNELKLTQIDDYKWQPINEYTMSKLLDINRSTLKKHREKIASGEIPLNSSIEGFIDGIPSIIKFCGEEGKGNKKRMIWQATPVNNLKLIR